MQEAKTRSDVARASAFQVSHPLGIGRERRGESSVHVARTDDTNPYMHRTNTARLLCHMVGLLYCYLLMSAQAGGGDGMRDCAPTPWARMSE